MCNEDGIKLSIKPDWLFSKNWNWLEPRVLEIKRNGLKTRWTVPSKTKKLKKSYNLVSACKHGCRHGSERVLTPKTNKSFTWTHEKSILLLDMMHTFVHFVGHAHLVLDKGWVNAWYSTLISLWLWTCFNGVAGNKEQQCVIVQTMIVSNSPASVHFH